MDIQYNAQWASTRKNYKKYVCWFLPALILICLGLSGGFVFCINLLNSVHICRFGEYNNQLFGIF
jgi:hypothetical protein